MSLILNEEEQMLQTLVRDFADRELAPRAREMDPEAGVFLGKLARNGQHWLDGNRH